MHIPLAAMMTIGPFRVVELLRFLDALRCTYRPGKLSGFMCSSSSCFGAFVVDIE